MSGPLLRAALASVVAFLSPAAQLAAQDKPDFSGTWVLESAPQSSGNTPRALLVSQSVVRTNVRGEPMKPFFKDITVSRVLESGTQSATYRIGVVGGMVSGRADGTVTSPQVHHRVGWEEDTLVIESGSYTGPEPETGEWTERREMWSFDSGGRLNIAIITQSSLDASKTVKLVYRRL